MQQNLKQKNGKAIPDTGVHIVLDGLVQRVEVVLVLMQLTMHANVNVVVGVDVHLSASPK